MQLNLRWSKENITVHKVCEEGAPTPHVVIKIGLLACIARSTINRVSNFSYLSALNFLNAHPNSKVYDSFVFFTKIQNWQYCQLCTPIFLQFPSLFALYDVSKFEIRCQWEKRIIDLFLHDCRLMSVLFISNVVTETKLAILAT